MRDERDELSRPGGYPVTAPPPLGGYPPLRQAPPPPGVRPVTLLLVLVFGLLAGFLLYRVWDRGTPGVNARPVTPAGDLAASEKATIELFQKVSPSVVYITMLARTMNLYTRDVRDVPQGTGSGFLWDNAGHVVTNYHVIRGATGGAQVTLANHQTFGATVVGAAPQYDVAVLRINAPASDLHPIPFIGASTELQVGQNVFAIGNPYGLDQTLTTGIVSALGRTIQGVEGNPIEDVIQTDAAINPGNSGGPLLDSSGRLIGVNSAIYSTSGSSAGIGFAIPVDVVNRVVPQLVRNGKVTRPDPGLVLDRQVSVRLARALGVEGVLILGVKPDSPAAAVGLRNAMRAPNGAIAADIIVAVDGKAVRTVDEFYMALDRHQPGDTVTLSIVRDGERQDVKVPLQAGQ